MEHAKAVSKIASLGACEIKIAVTVLMSCVQSVIAMTVVQSASQQLKDPNLEFVVVHKVCFITEVRIDVKVALIIVYNVLKAR